MLRIRDVYPGSRANFQRIIELFTQKIVNKLSKIWIWDPGSGKNLLRFPEKNYQTARLEPLLASSLLRQVQVLTPLNKLQFRIHFEKLTLIT